MIYFSACLGYLFITIHLQQVAYAWAISLGSTDGPQLLKKLGLVDHAIDYAMDSCAFPHAFDIARACAQHKLPEIHLKYAMYLEDEGHFKEAEEEFINAGNDLQDNIA